MAEDNGSNAPADGDGGNQNGNSGGENRTGRTGNTRDGWQPPRSQEEFDSIFETRLGKERNKLREQFASQYAGYDDFKTKAEQLDSILETQKSKEEKLEERASSLEKQLTPLQQENARLKVAVAKGLPSNLIDRLRGNAKEEIEADADELMKLVRADEREFPDLGGGRRGNSNKPKGMDDLIRRGAGRT